jgi:hypothetical protein
MDRFKLCLKPREWTTKEVSQVSDAETTSWTGGEDLKGYAWPSATKELRR